MEPSENEEQDYDYNYNPGNRGGGLKESGKAVAKGAVKGAGKEGIKKAGQEGVKEGAKGVKKGAQVGAKVGGAIPYVGAVTGPIGGVVGGVVGGAGGAAYGTAKGGIKGAAEGATKGAKEELENTAKNRSKNNSRKILGSLKDNIIGAIRGDKKQLFILKVKLIAIVVVFAIVLATLLILGVVEETSGNAKASIATTFQNSTSEAAAEFNKSGSLILATDAELKEINDNFMKSIENKTDVYYNSFTTKYSGKTSTGTVVNNVKNITTNYEANETAEVEKISTKPTSLVGEASLADERTIFEHILRAEKYNFNNIIWRSFVKSGSGLKQENISFVLDAATKLKYPAMDAAEIDSSEHNLQFFLTKTRPYLQSWYIPFDMAVGSDKVIDSEVNTKFAYEIMASGYHEIVMDRYKVEKLTRTTNYVVYDQKATLYKTTRTCAKYIIQDEEGVRHLTTYCVDDKLNGVELKAETKEDIRESLGVENETSYRWDYVISQAKLFDNVISNEYKFEALYNYPTTSYNNYINKTGEYASKTAEEYGELEQSNSKSDGYSHVGEPYYEANKVTLVSKKWWNEQYVVSKIPENAQLFPNTTEIKVVFEERQYEKEGTKYEDIYVWNDSLNFENTKSGIYNVDSVKDVTGDDLTSKDKSYYEDLYNSQEINIIDLMNSDKKIYSNYLSTENMNLDTENIGIRKYTLELAYAALESDLKKNLEEYSMNSIKYGMSLGIDTDSFTTLSGLSFGNMENIAAGNLEGKNVAYPLATEELNKAYLQVGRKYGNSYGYRGHGGVDISYNYADADKALCKDYSNSVCPYIRGPAIYAAMDGTISSVTYCPYNKYYNVGKSVGKYTDGKLNVNSTTGWGTNVKIVNADGTGVVYAHLFPDKDFLKQLSELVGQPISAGTFIGYMGNTGSSTGLHLHIEFGPSVNELGGDRTSNSSLTYTYLMKIIDIMGVSPRIA